MIRRIPAWYRKRRAVAQRLYEKKKPAKYGPDIDLELFTIDVPVRARIDSMYDLSVEERTASRGVGTRDDEDYRGGTYFQYDRNVIYLHYTDLLKEHLPRGLIVEDTLEAIRKRPWLEGYWFRACPLNLDKYTAFVGSHETAGAFVWSLEGAKVPYPIQACLFLGTDLMVQVPHNFIIAEPDSSVHLITGCTVHPVCKSAAHVACTEIYVKRGAEVTWTMIHAWKPQFHIRPRMGAIV
ncbi:MAG: SufD family Fe-S cluster assembly protein, partial [Candidatus Bathyarchaeia archaeon]